MDRHLGYLLVVPLAALLWPQPSLATEACPTDSTPHQLDGATRTRAIVSMFVPSVYATLTTGGTHDARWPGKGDLPAPRPKPRDTRLDRTGETSWEFGLTWNPVRILRRSRRLTRARRRMARRRLTPDPRVCPVPASLSETETADGSFEEHLEQVITRRKRDALIDVLD